MTLPLVPRAASLSLRSIPLLQRAVFGLLMLSLWIACAGKEPSVASPTSPSGLAAPGAFGKRSPADKGINLSFFATLSWQASTGATSYEYCVDASLNGACNATWTSVSTPMVSDIPLPSPNQAYEWQVRARNAAGLTEANGGAWWTFTLAGPA